MSRGGIVWLTGIPASGKSTIAGLLANKIKMTGGHAEVLDGDEIRTMISKGLGFSREDRRENVRRISWIARKLARNGVWAIVAAVSPFAEDRAEARTEAAGDGTYFLEVHTKCPVTVAQTRDPKGLYKASKDGAVKGVTGVDAPYETSPSAFVIDTVEDSPEEATTRIWDVILWRPDDNPPIIVTGRGHTGTRLASKLIQDVGVFIGQKDQINGCEDSLEWVSVIYKMVQECANTAEMPTGNQYKSEIRNVARFIIKNGHISPGTPWGWKLPETTLVLPFFLDAFPKMKLIHCVRHPVSSSIRGGHLTSDPYVPVGKASVAGAYAYYGRDPGRMKEDEDWYRSAITWLHQTERTMKFGRSLPAGHYLELKYEDMCASPDWALSSVERFTKFRRQRERTSIEIQPERMNRWDPKDPRAARIWEVCERAAKALGYKFLEGCNPPEKRS